MSGPVPSPRMNGMIGSFGTARVGADPVIREPRAGGLSRSYFGMEGARKLSLVGRENASRSIYDRRPSFQPAMRGGAGPCTLRRAIPNAVEVPDAAQETAPAPPAARRAGRRPGRSPRSGLRTTDDVRPAPHRVAVPVPRPVPDADLRGAARGESRRKGPHLRRPGALRRPGDRAGRPSPHDEGPEGR